MAIDLITEHIRMKLQQPELRRIYHNLELMPSNFQIRGMHTLIRDRSTSKADFVFYADRLLRLVASSLFLLKSPPEAETLLSETSSGLWRTPGRDGKLTPHYFQHLWLIRCQKALGLHFQTSCVPCRPT